MTEPVKKLGFFGTMGRFETPEALVHAAERARQAGYVCLDAYSPMPVHGLAAAIGFHRTWMPQIVLAGGIFGCIAGFAFCYYITVLSYPHNVGGRPLYSWPAYIPITFETTVLCAALSAVIGMLGLNKLPMPYHPVFNHPTFSTASQSAFFLCIQSNDPQFEPEAVRAFLLGENASEVMELES